MRGHEVCQKSPASPLKEAKITPYTRPSDPARASGGNQPETEETVQLDKSAAQVMSVGGKGEGGEGGTERERE